MAASSSTLLEKGALVLNPSFCPLLVSTTPVVSIGSRSNEEILLLAVSHWSFLNDSPADLNLIITVGFISNKTIRSQLTIV